MNTNEMNIVYRKVTEITPYENNPRINDASVDAVANSIEEFGFKVPIVIDKNNVIINGHTRLKAALKLGLTEVPTIMADDLTEEQVKAFRIADNKVGETSEWDISKLKKELDGIKDIDMTDFNIDFEEINAKFSQLTDSTNLTEDNFDIEKALEEAEEPTSKLGDIYKLGNHYLMCGDSTKEADVKKLLQNGQVDLVVTDPPYNVNFGRIKVTTDKKTHKTLKAEKGDDFIKNDNMGDAEFKKFLLSTFKNMKASLKDGASFYVWYATQESINFYSSLKEVGLTVRQQLIWNKNQPTIGRSDYQNKFEPCLYGWKDGKAHYFIDDRTEKTVIEDVKKENIKKMKKDELVELLEEILKDKTIADVLDEDKPLVSELHPTMKPIKLFGRLIRNSSKINDKVLDLFGGSGTTLIVCEQMNRSAYIMEYDPKYADVIIKRWEEFTGKKAEKINGNNSSEK